jgi:hypothetical protein
VLEELEGWLPLNFGTKWKFLAIENEIHQKTDPVTS